MKNYIFVEYFEVVEKQKTLILSCEVWPNGYGRPSLTIATAVGGRVTLKEAREKLMHSIALIECHKIKNAHEYEQITARGCQEKFCRCSDQKTRDEVWQRVILEKGADVICSPKPIILS